MSPTFPRGIEVLLKKAAVDPEFRALLLDDLEKAAEMIALELDPVERSMLKTMPPKQLAIIIDRTTVPQAQRRAFLGTAAAAMLAALTGVSNAHAGGEPQWGQGSSTGGIRPNEVSGSSAGNRPGGVNAGAGVRPDVRIAGIGPDIPPKKSGPERVREMVIRELEISDRKLTPKYSWKPDERQLQNLRQAVYDEFDVRMPARVLRSLNNIEKLTAYIAESLEGYEEKGSSTTIIRKDGTLRWQTQ